MASLTRLLFLLGVTLLLPVHVGSQSVDGIRGLANRLFNGHGGDFEFSLTTEPKPWSRWNEALNDNYTVSKAANGKIRIQGTTLNALARGLRHYAVDNLRLDDFWFVDNYRQLPEHLPAPARTLEGSSVVPWRYSLNTVTFSYTFAWYSWEDWEKFLDWAAWRGVNLQLAWVGYEKIFLDSFRDLGMTDDEILTFFSGPAFQSWNRFGNIRKSWGNVGNLPLAWIESQFDMQKRIVARMVELGITPVLPAFPGFVPDAISRVRPNANITKAPNWFGVAEYSEDYFLDPFDATSAELQHSFVTKQMEAFGNVTNIYTLDQFNEMVPSSGETAYLSGVSRQTYKALTEANPAAIWLMQGWLFFSSEAFWTQERIEAYLGGVEEKKGMLILDLYSENHPQWQRTKGYAGRPWIWCQLHNFGSNMNMFGQITSITVDPIVALKSSDSMVGFGITAEGYEGNEVVYDLFLDQAWSKTAIDTMTYFQNWTSSRYGGVSPLPEALYQAWELIRQPVYDCKDPGVPRTGVGVYQLLPSISGMVNRTGIFPAPTLVHYDPNILKQAWSLMLKAGVQKPNLWDHSAFQLDVVDVTRQVMTNSFVDIYTDLVEAFNTTVVNSKQREKQPSAPACDVSVKGQKLLSFLEALDLVLSTNEHFTLAKWLRDAQQWAAGYEKIFSFNARSQVTTWFWEVPGLNDYSARAWSGLTRSYYRQRWSIFIDGLKNATKTGSLNETALNQEIRAFEKQWQYGGFEPDIQFKGPNSSVRDVVSQLQEQWPDIFRVTF